MGEDGGAYGEDPYGDAGHAYAYGHEYGGGVGTDTGTKSWDAVELAQWTLSEYSTHATWTDPLAAGARPYVAGPDPSTTAWDSPHGDVLTVPPPEFDTGAPISEPETPANESVRPVFVDSSGRRRRRVLRATRLLMIPAGGYVALLISTMLGGPGIGSPFGPQPDSTHPATPRGYRARRLTRHWPLRGDRESHRRAAELRPCGAEDPRSHRRLRHSCGHVRAHRGAHRDHVPDLARRSHPHPQGSCHRLVPPSREVIQGPDVADRRLRDAPARQPPYDGLPQATPHPEVWQPGPSETPQSY
ncbi:hypothetical protein ACFRIB_04480 [Streptomyces mirabilis]|uniref:hypothetical protein n=1 Tax=Streptomyces mirabilis TaxID=68239 RepID=UPI0036C155D5